MAIKICLDAGHKDGENSMASKAGYSGYCEGTRMFVYTHNYLAPKLKAYGFQVVETRTKSSTYANGSTTSDNLDYRGKCATGCDLFLSLHTNACGTESVRRPVVIYPISGYGKDLAQKIVDGLKPVLGVTNSSIYSKKNSAGTADYYGVIRSAVKYGCKKAMIIEHDFHTNKVFCAWAMKDSNLDKMAQNVADTIAKYYGYSKTTVTATTTTTTSTNTATTTQTSTTIMYRVRKTWADSSSQKGAYSNYDYAKKCADSNPGYTVFDSNGKALYTSATASGATTPVATAANTTANTTSASVVNVTAAEAKSYTNRLLKHYPFVYCPTLAGKTTNHTPNKGDIVLFYNSGTYTHTGYVYAVDNTYFYTIEGNTSGASGIVANGGGVCKKSYKIASYASSKFFRPDYSILVEGKIFSSTTAAINAIIATATAEVGYLEKKSNAYLDDKTANAGSNNYTKYWRDISSGLQAQPWCACFVTWIIQMSILNNKKVATTTQSSNNTNSNTSSTTTNTTTTSKGEYEKLKTWINGSTEEPVYSCTHKETKIGSIDPNETAQCPCKVGNMYLVIYTHAADNSKKVGLVNYHGGLE